MPTDGIDTDVEQESSKNPYLFEINYTYRASLWGFLLSGPWVSNTFQKVPPNRYNGQAKTEIFVNNYRYRSEITVRSSDPLSIRSYLIAAVYHVESLDRRGKAPPMPSSHSSTALVCARDTLYVLGWCAAIGFVTSLLVQAILLILGLLA